MSDLNREFEKQFAETKRRSFLQVLFKAARLTNEEALERARRATGADWLRPAHTTLFPHIDAEGLRLTALAERIGVTKQAVQQLVDELEEVDLVERVPDPSDGRAKLIRWSRSGWDEIDASLARLMEFEAELAERVGEDELRVAHEVLLRMVDWLEEK